MLKPNSRHSIQIIQAYAAEKVERFYDDLTTAKNTEKTKNKIIIGDFNAKIGRKEIGDLQNIGNFGLGKRNARGRLLLEFLYREGMFCANTFFQKPNYRKWTHGEALMELSRTRSFTY